MDLPKCLDSASRSHICERAPYLVTKQEGNPVTSGTRGRISQTAERVRNLSKCAVGRDGVGSVFGGVPTFFHYFNPRNGPFVVAFYIATALISLVLCYWVIFRGGAEELLRHPGFINLSVDKAWVLKAVAILAVASEVVAFTTTLLLDIQVPRFVQD